MPSPPTWLSTFVDRITSSICSYDHLAPLGCHFQHVEGVWEITVFASQSEVIGGPMDGKLRSSPFNVEVKPVLEAFTSVETVNWQAHRIDSTDELGPHLAIEGWHDDKPIWLRITSTAPDRFGPGRHILVNRQTIQDIW